MTIPGPTPKQARILWASTTTLAIGVLLGLIFLLLWGFGWMINQLTPVLLPLAVAGIIAYLLDPVVDYFERKRLRRPIAISLVFFLALAIFLGLIGSVIPRLIEEFTALNKRLPAYSAKLSQKLNNFFEHPPLNLPLPQSWSNWWYKAKAPVPTNAASNSMTLDLGFTMDTNPPPPTVSLASTNASAIEPVQFDSQFSRSFITSLARALPLVSRWILDQLSRAASLVGMLIGFALVPVYTFYLLWEKKGIAQNWTNYLPIHESAAKEELVFILKSINYYLILFFRGQVLVALCDGALLTIGFLLIGLDFAILLGFIAGILSIVPYLGIILSIVPALALAFVQFGDWLHPLLILLNFAVVQMLEGMVVSPKIIGDRVGLHPLTIIIAVMVGTTLMGGILGGILAIPLTAALRVLMFRYVWKTRRSTARIPAGTL